MVGRVVPVAFAGRRSRTRAQRSSALPPHRRGHTSAGYSTPRGAVAASPPLVRAESRAAIPRPASLPCGRAQGVPGNPVAGSSRHSGFGGRHSVGDLVPMRAHARPRRYTLKRDARFAPGRARHREGCDHCTPSQSLEVGLCRGCAGRSATTSRRPSWISCGTPLWSLTNGARLSSTIPPPTRPRPRNSFFGGVPP